MTVTDPVDQLAEHAPVLRSDLDHLLPDLGARPRTVRRRLLLVGAAAALTTGLVALPLVMPLSAPDAAAVENLSQVAGRVPAQAPDRVLHQVVVDWQADEPGLRTLESWTMPDGSIWRRDVENDGEVDYYHFEPTAEWLTPPIAGLPSDPAALEATVRRQVSGSSSTNEAMFTYYGDALRLGSVPAPTRKAMVIAMGRLPFITVQRTTTADGVACLKIAYREPMNLFTGKYYCFDESTSTIVEEGDVGWTPQTYRSTRKLYEYVAAVPESVKAAAAQQRTKEAGAEPGAPTPTPERTPR